MYNILVEIIINSGIILIIKQVNLLVENQNLDRNNFELNIQKIS